MWIICQSLYFCYCISFCESVSHRGRGPIWQQGARGEVTGFEIAYIQSRQIHLCSKDNPSLKEPFCMTSPFTSGTFKYTFYDKTCWFFNAGHYTIKSGRIHTSQGATWIIGFMPVTLRMLWKYVCCSLMMNTFLVHYWGNENLVSCERCCNMKRWNSNLVVACLAMLLLQITLLVHISPLQCLCCKKKVWKP